LDFNLRVGAVSSETVVTSGVSQVETQSAALSSVMDKDSIRELPLNGRDIVQLALLKRASPLRAARRIRRAVAYSFRLGAAVPTKSALFWIRRTSMTPTTTRRAAYRASC
jgi:hypothetical protein